MDKTVDVTALGELLVDFTENGQSGQGNPLLEANPGGAPCNVLAMLAKLGKRCAFIGKVGDDMFGHGLADVAKEAGVDTCGLVVDPQAHTTLAFVKTFPNGDRDFSFYRDPGADMMLKREELQKELIRRSRIFHFGTLSMTHPEVREATLAAVCMAQDKGALISFDPNLRPPLWKSLEDAKVQMEWGMAHCDILKIADNELEFMTGTQDYHQGALLLQGQFPNIKVLNVTAGASGSYCLHEGKWVFAPALRLGGTIETTGAGDTFCGCVLNYILDHGVSNLAEEEMKEMLQFANAAAYLVTTRKGAIKSMPDPGEVLGIWHTGIC